MTTGDFFDELGLQDGDRPIMVNGMVALDDWDGVVDAFFLLLNGETEFTLRVNRGSSNIDLHYEIVP